MLSEPLDRRCIALTGIAAPGGMLGWLLKRARAHPAHATAVTATATAATVAAAVLVSKAAPSPARPPASFPAGCLSQGHSHLTIGGRPVPQARVRHSIRSIIGEPARAFGVTVQSVVAHNGFCAGTSSARRWVQLVGPLEPMHIRSGDRVRFTGTVVGNKPSYPGRAGVGRSQGAGLLVAQGPDLAVKTTKIVVMHSP